MPPFLLPTTYDFRVLAYAYTGGASADDTASVTTPALPNQPTLSSATAQSATSVALAWGDMAGETGFLVERSTNGGLSWTTAGIVGTGVTTFTHTGLTEATTYTYVVTATNAAGSSAPSAALTVATQPAAPSSLTATAVSPVQINLSWTDQSTAATSYDVEQSPDDTNWTVIGTVDGSTATSFTATGPFNGSTTYDFRVQAYDDTGGDSAFTPVASVTTAGYPSYPTVTATAQSDTAITLTWADVAGETGFRVERYVPASATWTVIGLVSAGVTTCTDTGLREGSAFTYRVFATNAVGDSAPSASVTATTLTAAPTGLAANAIAWNQINLSWTDNSTLATAYYIQQSTDDATWTQVGSISGPGAISFSATGPFLPSTTYDFRVDAYSPAGGYSNYATLTTTTPAYPSQPTILSAAAQSNTSVLLTWNNPSGASGLLVQRLVGGAWTTVGTVGAGVTTYTDSGLTESTSYSYEVFATNAVGDSIPSATETVTTLPAAPTGLTANAVAWNQVNLTWNDLSLTALSYDVQQSSDGVNWTTIALIAGNTADSDTATGPFSASTTYYFRVNDYASTGGYSNDATISVGTPAFPSAPSGVQAVVASSSSINVSWADVANETGFIVERSTSGGAWAVAGTTGTGVTTFTDTGLQLGIPYRYRIQASNSAGDSPYSGTASLTIIDPTANSDSYTALHDRALTVSAAAGVLANDTDAYGLSLSATIVGEPTYGTVSLQANGSFSYTPPADWVGTDTFTYQDSDGPLSSNVATVTIVIDDPHAPVAVNEAYTTPHDTTLAVTSPSAGVLANDSDADGDTLTASLVTSTADGSLTFNPDGTFTYVPDAGFYGEDFFTYQASDGVLTSAATTDTITVTPTGGSTPLVTASLFADDFSESTLDPAWQTIDGTWTTGSGTLSQTSTASDGSNKLILSDVSFPADLEITAQVEVNSWSGTSPALVGVGVNSDSTTGDGYNLVFTGANTVAFLDDSTDTWGNSYTFSWSTGTSYNFALEIVGSTLYGSVWAAGTTQPATWMFEQTGWTDATGAAPAVDGGIDGGATASFQNVSVNYAPDDPADFDPTPEITDPASASDDDVTGDSTELSIGVDIPGGDDSNLTFEWIVLSAPDGAIDPMLSDNDSATADDITAQFWMAGDYTFEVIADNGGSSATSEVSVTVEQTATSLMVTPADTVVVEGASLQYEATVDDQFGNPMESPPSIDWSVDGVGTIDQTGYYTAPDDEAGDATIEAETGDVSNTLAVSVTAGDVINFDNLTAGTIVTNQYPEATFSGDPDFPNEVLATTDASQPNSIGAPTPASDGGDSVGNPYTHPLYVDFTVPVDDLQFLQMRDDSAAGVQIEQVNVFQNGVQTTTVPVYSTGAEFTPGVVDLAAYTDVTRIEIVNVTDPAGLLYDNFQFTSGDLLVAHRTGDNQGEAVTDQVKNSDDPSQYTVLVDDYYVQSDGTPALDSDTAEIPDDSGDGDSDLAQITLNQLPSGMTDGYVQIVLSDPTAVRLFESDGSLLYDDDTTGDAPLTLDLSDPSGYLAGLESGSVDVWLEGVHANTDFSFTILYENSQGDIIASDSVHMTLADWTFVDYDGEQLAAITPIWSVPFLTTLDQDVESGTQGGVGEEPQDSTFKNQILGLSDSSQVQMQVESLDDSSESYMDDLIPTGGGLISEDFGAMFSSEEIYGADPEALLTQGQEGEIQAVDGINALDGDGQQSTLTVGPPGNTLDSFTRRLVSPGPITIVLNNATAVYDAGDWVTVVVTESKINGGVWDNGLDATVSGVNGPISDSAVLAGVPTGVPGQFSFQFRPTVAAYITFTVNNTVRDVDPNDKLGVTANYTNSVTIMVVGAGQTLSTWQQQAWQSLMINGVVTGNVINRNRQITTLYANMYNSNTQAFGWAGMAAFASNVAGEAMAKAANPWTYQSAAGALTGIDSANVLNYLGQGNLAIFMDMYPQLLAYSQPGVGLANITAMAQQKQITPQQLEGWTDINNGINNNNQDLVWQGSGLILYVEQVETIQTVFNKDLGLWKKITDLGPLDPKTGPFKSPIPGDKSTFQGLYPGQSISNGWLKYQWAITVMVPAFRKWQQTNATIDVGKLLNGGYDN